MESGEDGGEHACTITNKILHVKVGGRTAMLREALGTGQQEANGSRFQDLVSNFS